MPTPYARDSADLYYEYGGRPQTYVADWRGMPQGSGRAAESSSLGSLGSSSGLGSLGGNMLPTHRVSLGQKSVLHSGPEQSPLHDALRPEGMGAEPKAFATGGKMMLAGAVVAVWWFFLRKK